MGRGCSCSKKKISKRFELITSAYTVSYGTPSWSSVTVLDSILLKKITVRSMQYIVAAPSFYKRGMDKFHVVMLENSKAIGCLGEVKNFVPERFAGSLCFIRMSTKNSDCRCQREPSNSEGTEVLNEKQKVVAMNAVSCNFSKFQTSKAENRQVWPVAGMY